MIIVVRIVGYFDEIPLNNGNEKEKLKIETIKRKIICNSIDSKPFISPRLVESPLPITY